MTARKGPPAKRPPKAGARLHLAYSRTGPPAVAEAATTLTAAVVRAGEQAQTPAPVTPSVGAMQGLRDAVDYASRASGATPEDVGLALLAAAASVLSQARSAVAFAERAQALYAQGALAHDARRGRRPFLPYPA